MSNQHIKQNIWNRIIEPKNQISENVRYFQMLA